MTELIYLLFNGPKLEKQEVKTTRVYVSTKKPPEYLADKYKPYSEGGKIWSLLVAKHEPITGKTAARHLRSLCNDGLLKPVGRLKGTRSNSPPYIYEWVQ